MHIVCIHTSVNCVFINEHYCHIIIFKKNSRSMFFIYLVV